MYREVITVQKSIFFSPEQQNPVLFMIYKLKYVTQSTKFISISEKIVIN